MFEDFKRGKSLDLTGRPLASDFGIGQWQVGSDVYTSDGINWISLAAKTTNIPEIALSRYRSIPNSSARKIAWVGDSTTQQLFTSSVGGFANILSATPGTDYISYLFNYPGGPTANVTHGNFGLNGGTLSNYLANVNLGYNLADIVNFVPNLIVFSYGINDVRLGLTSKATLIANLKIAINALQAALPNTDIILRMPNSLLYDAANTSSYIDAPTSLIKVQGYSDILRQAYEELKGYFVNCYVLDTQSGEGAIFSKSCQTTPGYYMSSANDALHPSGEGYAAVLREIILAIGNYGNIRYPEIWFTKPLLPTAAIDAGTNATQINSTTDYLIYPRVVEDTAKYNLIVEGLSQQINPGVAFIISDNTLTGVAKNWLNAIQTNDIVIQYGVTSVTGGNQNSAIVDGAAAWQWTGSGIFENGNNLNWTVIPTYPLAQNSFQPVRVYRKRPATQKNDASKNLGIVLSNANFATGTLTFTTQQAGLIGAIAATAVTGPTTGGTITIAVNGVTVATLTFANSGVTATGSGTFFTAGTRGLWINEGDIITATINAGFVAGTNLRVTLGKY